MVVASRNASFADSRPAMSVHRTFGFSPTIEFFNSAFRFELSSSFVSPPMPAPRLVATAPPGPATGDGFFIASLIASARSINVAA